MSREICSTCNGSGLVPLSENVTSDAHYTYTYCTDCGGKGYFDDEDEDD